MKLVAATLAALLASAALASAGSLEDVKSSGALRIGTEGTYAPFTFHDTSGKLVGFDVEIGEAVAEKLGATPIHSLRIRTASPIFCPLSHQKMLRE